MHLKKLVTAFFLIGYFINASAQTNECEQTLNQAAEEFNAGHFYGIPSLLKPCIEKNAFSSEQQVRAYLLLCQAYLIIDDPIAAEDSYLRLLKADPEYIATDEKDPIDVVFLSKKFTSTPVFTPHIRLGGNTSLFRTIYDINTYSLPGKVNHILKPGFQVGGGVDLNINDNISLCADVILSYKAYKNVRPVFTTGVLTVTEKQFWLDVPIYLKYTDHKGLIRPFGYIGFAPSYLLNSKASLELVISSPSRNSQTITTGPDVSFTHFRHRLNRSVVIGGGVRYKIGKDFVFADLRYMVGLSSLSTNPYKLDPGDGQNPQGKKTVSDLATLYGYVDPIFRMDNLSLSIGYVRPLYDPRKIKKARGVKSVSRKIRKESKHDAK